MQIAKGAADDINTGLLRCRPTLHTILPPTPPTPPTATIATIAYYRLLSLLRQLPLYPPFPSNSLLMRAIRTINRTYKE